MSDHLSPDLEALLVDALSGDLDPADRARLDEAIAADPSIADLLDDQAAIAAELASDAGSLSELEAARMRRSVLDEVAPVGERAPTGPNPWVRWAFSAAAILVLVVGAVGFIRSSDDGLQPIGLAEVVTESATDVEESGETARIEAPEAGDDSDDAGDLAATDGAAFDAGGDASLDEAAAVGPACEGTKVVWATDEVHPDVESVIASLREDPPAGVELEGEPFVWERDGLVVLTWFSDVGPDTQFELEPVDAGWTIVSETNCGP